MVKELSFIEDYLTSEITHNIKIYYNDRLIDIIDVYNYNFKELPEYIQNASKEFLDLLKIEINPI